MNSTPAEEPNRAELLRLYELAVQEYRFQVLLNWDRTKHVLASDAILLGVAAGLYKLSGQAVFTSIVLVFVAINSVLGAVGVQTGHRYYRSTRRHMAAVAKRLGLPAAGLAMETTSGMAEEHDPSRVPVSFVTRNLRFLGRITTHITVLLAFIAAVALASAVMLLTR